MTPDTQAPYDAEGLLEQMETVVKTPGLSSPCPMEGGEGLLPAFGLGFTPHIQRQACTDLRLRAYPVDLFLHLAIAPVTPLHRIRRRGQQLVIEKRQGFVQGGGKEFLQRVTEGCEPLDTPPQLGQFGEGGLGPTAPIEYRVHLLHDRPQRLSLGYPTADAPQGLPFGFVEVTLDEQMS
jgi:hypothetical protein